MVIINENIVNTVKSVHFGPTYPRKTSVPQKGGSIGGGALFFKLGLRGALLEGTLLGGGCIRGNRVYFFAKTLQTNPRNEVSDSSIRHFNACCES